MIQKFLKASETVSQSIQVLGAAVQKIIFYQNQKGPFPQCTETYSNSRNDVRNHT